MRLRRTPTGWRRIGITVAAVVVAAFSVVTARDVATAAVSPQAQLSSVSCPTDTFCMAVGARLQNNGAPSLGLAYRWDGARWHVMATQAPPSGWQRIELRTVSCTSATFCTALGFTGRAASGDMLIAERWNGAFWRFMGIQRPGNADSVAVSCVGRASCVAVGTRTTQLNGRSIERAVAWQLVGDTFQLRPTAPRPFPRQFLRGVSCIAVDNCTAVGAETVYDHPLAEHWNGRQWSWVGPLPPSRPFTDPGVRLGGVSCPAPRSCVAVGGSGSTGLAAIENQKPGEPWRYGSPGSWPGGDEEGALFGVSCTVFQRCAAVGSTLDRGGTHYAMTAWRDFRTGHFVLAEAPAFFYGVACLDAGCVYVGADTRQVGAAQHPVIYRGRAHPTQELIPPPPA
jgi:hypothetical protein